MNYIKTFEQLYGTNSTKIICPECKSENIEELHQVGYTRGKVQGDYDHVIRCKCKDCKKEFNAQLAIL